MSSTSKNIGKIVLGSMLSASSLGGIDLDAVLQSGIEKSWFGEDDGEQSLFEVMRLLHAARKPFDDTLILKYLEKSKVKEPEAVLLSVMAQKPVPHAVLMEYVGELKEGYRKTQLSAMARWVLQSLDDGELDVETISLQAQNDLSERVLSKHGGHAKTLKQIEEELEEEPEKPRLPTGIPFIDTVLTDDEGTSGLPSEGLIYISGLKESGKTFIMTRMIENISQHSPVLFGSLEFGKKLYAKNAKKNREKKQFYGNNENILVFDDIYDTEHIIAEIRLQHKLVGIKAAFLDSMLRMTNNSPDLGTDEKRMSDMFSKLGKLSKELHIPIAIIVQSAKEDLKSSVVSVKGAINADHEGFIWFHLMKTKPKDDQNELRTVKWVKNKDTMKHPKQHLMFVPQTADFYRVELDDNGHPGKPMDKYRKPQAKPVEIVYEHVPAEPQDTGHVSIPTL